MVLLCNWRWGANLVKDAHYVLRFYYWDRIGCWQYIIVTANAKAYYNQVSRDRFKLRKEKEALKV